MEFSDALCTPELMFFPRRIGDLLDEEPATTPGTMPATPSETPMQTLEAPSETPCFSLSERVSFTFYPVCGSRCPPKNVLGTLRRPRR